MSSQMNIRLADYEATAPPEKTLSIAVVAGVVFLSIENAKEDYNSSTYNSDESGRIAIYIEDFQNALATCWADDINGKRRKDAS